MAKNLQATSHGKRALSKVSVPHQGKILFVHSLNL